MLLGRFLAPTTEQTLPPPPLDLAFGNCPHPNTHALCLHLSALQPFADYGR